MAVTRKVNVERGIGRTAMCLFGIEKQSKTQIPLATKNTKKNLIKLSSFVLTTESIDQKT